MKRKTLLVLLIAMILVIISSLGACGDGDKAYYGVYSDTGTIFEIKSNEIKIDGESRAYTYDEESNQLLIDGYIGAMSFYENYRVLSFNIKNTYDQGTLTVRNGRFSAKLYDYSGYSIVSAAIFQPDGSYRWFDTRYPTLNSKGYYELKDGVLKIVETTIISKETFTEYWYIVGNGEYHYGVYLKDEANWFSNSTEEGGGTQNGGSQNGGSQNGGSQSGGSQNNNENQTPAQPEHVHSYTQMVTTEEYIYSEPNCTDSAKYYYSCSCGEKGTETFESGWVLSDAHNYIDTVVNPTKTQEGYTYHECSRCGDNYTDSYVPATGVSAGLKVEKWYSGNCRITGIGNCTDTEIVIPSKIDGYTVTSIGNYAFGECKSITSIVIPDTVEEIKEGAFYGCTSLKSVTLGNSVQAINQNTFSNCTLLKSIDIPNSVAYIGAEAFNGCKSLKSVNIGNGVTSIGRESFRECTSLSSITIGKNVSAIGDKAFYNCTSLGSFVIPDKVTKISDYTFEGCTALTSVTIAKSVKMIGSSPFKYCSSLNTIIFKGTKSEWNAKSKVFGWNTSVPATYVQCSDGRVDL